MNAIASKRARSLALALVLMLLGTAAGQSMNENLAGKTLCIASAHIHVTIPPSIGFAFDTEGIGDQVLEALEVQLITSGVLYEKHFDDCREGEARDAVVSLYTEATAVDLEGRGYLVTLEVRDYAFLAYPGPVTIWSILPAYGNTPIARRGLQDLLVAQAMEHVEALVAAWVSANP